MYIQESNVSLNGIHWAKWDIEIKKLAKSYSDCILLEGMKVLNIHPRFALPKELDMLIDFCEKETNINY